jgi:phosphoenolpyruvate carboxykinase (GTP)
MASNCPCISSEFNSLKGVPLTAIIFGGRRAKTAPLVYESRNWQHGTFVGSIMASETTAAAAGAVGVVRRDPMAMRPFVGYNMGDYFRHWLDMGKKIPNAPKIFHVNWFRTDDEGHFIWPGFGDNLRVLLWILDRCEGKVDAVETPIGFVPKAEDINIEGLDDVTIDTIRELLTIDNQSWLEDVANIKEFYAQVGDRVPAELYDELAVLEANLSK